MSLASGVGSDDPFAALVVPEPEPEDPSAEQDARGRAARLVRPAGMGVALVRRLLTATLLIGAALATIGAAATGGASHAGRL